MNTSSTPLAQRLRALPQDRLAGIRRGIEKESLRVRADATLAPTPHPRALGSALTHPLITTDFSEAQLELITGIHSAAAGCIGQLGEIHQAVYHELGDEMLWVGSMPCNLPSDDAIPIARYGRSNVGQAKTVYRLGLSHRYGRRMQTISGIHYNWSMPGVSTQQYFALIRNFRRHSFLLLLLFGASPAACASFVAGRPHPLTPIRGDTVGLPHATSLRMGRLGYQSDAQGSLAVSYNCLDSYANSLHEALTHPHPAYEAIGVRSAEGGYHQLSTTLLQIENEFYGTIRPKRTIRPGERPLHALRERGVEYVEVRCMDLDPFEPVGISEQTARFLDMFLLHCLLADSPPDTPREIAAIARNQDLTAMRGREAGLRLEREEDKVLLVDWAAELLDALAPVAEALDRLDGGGLHRTALASAHDVLADTGLAPSARVLDVMRNRFDGSYVEFTRSRSAEARHVLLERPWPAEAAQRFHEMAEVSLAKQREMEATDRMPFEQYRQRYLSAQRLSLDD